MIPAAIRRLFGGRSGGARVPRIDFAAESRCGFVRGDNQDSYLALPEANVFCVADGMGGGQGGAVASKMACDAVADAVAAATPDAPFAARIKAIADAVERANRDIFRYAADAGYEHMATTLAGLAVDPSAREKGAPFEAAAFHAGDSRIYRFRSGRMERLTTDHTLAEDAEMLRRRNISLAPANAMLRRTRLSHVLTRGVGIDAETHQEWKKIDVLHGDMYLLCSDGVYDMVPDDSIRFAFALGREPQNVVEILTRKIEAAGAKDNFTMVVAAVS